MITASACMDDGRAFFPHHEGGTSGVRGLVAAGVGQRMSSMLSSREREVMLLAAKAYASGEDHRPGLFV